MPETGAWQCNIYFQKCRAIQFSKKQLNYLMILVYLNTKIRVLRDNPRFAAYSPKCDLHSNNLEIECLCHKWYNN